MENIEWRDIEGYEGLYAVSNTGLVKRVAGSPRTMSDRILKPRFDKGGYLRRGLSKDGKETAYFVHRLVAKAFVFNPDPTTKIQVNHLNGIRDDNHYLNLEWCTISQNVKHSFDVLGKKPIKGNATLSDVEVRKIRELLESTALFQKDIGAMFGVKQSNISRIKNNVLWGDVV
jgi:hypothetical protein